MHLQKRALINLYWHLLWRTLQSHSMIRATILPRLTGAFNIRYEMTHLISQLSIQGAMNHVQPRQQ